MHCHVYASQQRSGAYLWLDRPQRIDDVPATLREKLGHLRAVLELDLDRKRKLPHQDAGTVLDNLRLQGWHLQLPPGRPPDVA